jgi:hypothetical protein
LAIVDELIAVLGYEIRDEAAAKRYEQSIERLNKRLSGFAAGAAKYGALAARAMGAAFGALGKSVVTTSAEFEGYQAALETIEGSADKAKQSLDWISEFGKTTPYDVAGVTDAFIKLKAYGIDPVADDALRILGDTASAMNKPLEQAVEAFADAASGEFERLKEFGIRSSSKGDEVTFAWTRNGKELNRTVKKNSEEIRKFLLENMGDRFNGAMLQQSKTWNGMMSNLGDSWTDFQRRIGDSGFFETVKGHLGDMLDYFGGLDADGTLDRWAANLSAGFTAVANTVVVVVKRIATHIDFLSEHFDKFSGPLKTLRAAIAFLLVRAFPLISIFMALAFVVDDFLTYLQGGESIIGDFIAKIQEITGVSEGVAQAITGLAGTIVAALAGGLIFAPGKMIKGFARILIGGIIRLAPLLVAAIGFLFTPAGLIVAIVGVGAALIAYFWDDIVEAWNGLSAKATELFSQMKDWFLNIDWKGVGVSIMNAIWEGMKSIADQIVEWFIAKLTENMPDALAKFLGLKDDPEAVAQPANKVSIKPTGETVSSYQPVKLSDDAWDEKLRLQQEEWSRLQGNLAKTGDANAANAVVNDSRQDNRNQSQTNHIQVNQTVTQATQAPAAAAQATGQAVGQAATAQRSQLEVEPSQWD